MLTTLAVPTEVERPQTSDNSSSGHLVFCGSFDLVPSVVFSFRLTLPQLTGTLCGAGPVAEPVLLIPICSADDGTRSKGQRLPVCNEMI